MTFLSDPKLLNGSVYARMISTLSIQYSFSMFFWPVFMVLRSNWTHLQSSTDLSRWAARCCSDESRRCSGGVWCSDSYSAHPQAGRPEYTRLPWMWWDIFVLEKIKRSKWKTHERQQRCGCYVRSKQLLQYKELIHPAATEAFLSPWGVCRVQGKWVEVWI